MVQKYSVQNLSHRHPSPQAVTIEHWKRGTCKIVNVNTSTSNWIRLEVKSRIFLGVRTLFAGSKCHDLVALDRSGNLISGHFDKKIRFWDTRNDTTRGELQFQAAITSLSINRGLSIVENKNKNQIIWKSFRKTTSTSLFTWWYIEINRTQGESSHANIQVENNIVNIWSNSSFIFQVILISKSVRIQSEQFCRLIVIMFVPVVTMELFTFGMQKRLRSKKFLAKNIRK